MRKAAPPEAEGAVPATLGRRLLPRLREHYLSCFLSSASWLLAAAASSERARSIACLSDCICRCAASRESSRERAFCSSASIAARSALCVSFLHVHPACCENVVCRVTRGPATEHSQREGTSPAERARHEVDAERS